jgi:hypothetical protein
VFTPGSIYQADMGMAFDKVQAAVKRVARAQRVKSIEPIADDEGVEDEMYAAEAGYLMGVQVGLRLRR